MSEQANVEYSYKLASAFVLDESELSKIDDLLRSNVGPVRFQAHCRDGRDRTFSTAAELLDYENASAREIRALSITAEDEANFRKNAKLELKSFKDYEGRNVSIRLSGSDASIDKVSNGLADRFEALKPWYGALTTVSFLVPLYVLVVGIAISAFAIWALTNGDSADEERIPVWVVTYGPAAVFFAPLLISSGLDRLRKAFFPLGVFCIGQGTKRHEDKEGARRIVLGGVVLTLVVGVIASLIAGFTIESI